MQQRPPQQQPPPQRPAPKKDDPVAQLNEIMSRLTVQGHNNQQQNQSAMYSTNQSMAGMGGMQPGMGMGGGNPFASQNPNMGMQNQFATANQFMGGGNPFATNMMMVQPNNPISY